MTIKLESQPVGVRNITKKFGSVIAVNNVSLEIPAGKFVTLLGPSGCGKTTLLRLIAGLELPTSGQVLLGDRDITYEQPNLRNTIMVFQSYALFPHMTVAENIGYGLRLSRLSKTVIAENVAEVLELVNMKGYGKRLSGELSGGQQQRVALARALVLKPKVLLFDEPLSNLDAKLRKKMRFELRSLQKDLGITSIYVTHDQSEALAMSDKIVVMFNGITEQMGSPEEIYTQPKSPFVADFIGEANLLPSEVVKADEGGSWLVTRDGQQIFVAGRNFKPGIQGNLMIRPEAIDLGEAVKDNTQEGMITESVYLGSYIEYELKLGSQTLRVDDYTLEKTYEKGQKVRFTFRQKGLNFIPAGI